MGAKFFPIVSRSKKVEQGYPLSSDFTRGTWEPVPAIRVLDEPGWSPYCIDEAHKELIFARTPASINLAEAAFFQITQYQTADAIITLPLDDVAALAQALPLPRVALVFSIGRCGTTLISHALNGTRSVYSLSEPGAFEHRPLRTLAAIGDTAGLIRDLCRLQFAGRSRPEAEMLAIKFRSQALFIAELFWEALPDASYVFMYRDAIGWGESFCQFLSDVGIPMPLDEAGRDLHWQMISADAPRAELVHYLDLDARPIATEAVLAAGWPFCLERYTQLLRRGVPFLALRYNELVTNQAGELKRLFTHCGIPHDRIAQALIAFDKDSQMGTGIARKGSKARFDETSSAIYRATLARTPAYSDPDFLLNDIYARDRQVTWNDIAR